MNNSKRVVLLILTKPIAAGSCLLFMLYFSITGFNVPMARSGREARRLEWIFLVALILLSNMFLSNVMQLWKAHRRTKRSTERRGAR